MIALIGYDISGRITTCINCKKKIGKYTIRGICLDIWGNRYDSCNRYLCYKCAKRYEKVIIGSRKKAMKEHKKLTDKRLAEAL